MYEGGVASVCSGLGWEADGSQFKSQYRQNLRGVLVMGQHKDMLRAPQVPLSKEPNP